MRSHVFWLCPDSHFAHKQFRNCTVQSKNSYFARQSENSHFAQDNSGIVPILTLRRTYIYVDFKPTETESNDLFQEKRESACEY